MTDRAMACFSSARPMPFLAMVGTTSTPRRSRSTDIVDVDPAPLGDIDHVQRNDLSMAGFGDLRDEMQAPGEVRGIGD